MAVSASRRRRILEEFERRLNAINSNDAFETDAGDRIYLGEAPLFGPDDEDDAIAVMPATDELGAQQMKVIATLPIDVVVMARWNLQMEEWSWTRVEQLLADVKRAIELDETQDPHRDLGGLLTGRLRRGPTIPLERVPGATSLGCAIRYFAPIAEAWGQP